MAVDKLVDSTQLDTDLASVANAIRTRGGTSADLAFPAGFVSAVGAIGNQYAASDEGKVVSNGELVAQTAHAEVTQNGTIDTTLNNSVTVNVSGGGGVTANKIASGTWAGSGNHIFTIPVGKKMPKTNFVFELSAEPDTEFAYNSSYKYGALVATVTDDVASYNLSSNGTINPTFDDGRTWKINNSGTITTINGNSTNACYYVRSGSVSTACYGNISIIKSESGFSVYFNRGNASYPFVSGVTYNWAIYYFGDSPSTEIVEVA